VGVDDDVDLFRLNANPGELRLNRLVFGLGRLLEGQLALDPGLVEPGVDHHLAVRVVNEEAVDREAELDALAVIPGREGLIQQQRAVVE
jgi:hypothetical protein